VGDFGVSGSEAKHHFKIGEVAEMLGVKPHVLRYWEQEFPALRPKKTRGAHRHYSRENVALAREIYALVVDAGYSIAGAKNKLGGSKQLDLGVYGEGDGEDELAVDLLAIRADLVALLDFVDGRTPRHSETETESETDEDVVVRDVVTVGSPRNRTR